MSAENPRPPVPFEPKKSQKQRKTAAQKGTTIVKPKTPLPAVPEQGSGFIPEVVSQRMIRRVLVFCGIPVEGNPKKSFAPDVFVVKNVRPDDRRVFKLWEEGAIPCFVLETTSRKTGHEDLGPKMLLYAKQIGRASCRERV